jgi:hypothetical protein
MTKYGWKNSCNGASVEAFTAVMFQVEVFWIMTPCNVVVGYQRFGGPWCLHLQSEGGGRLRQHGPLKRWCSATTLQGVIIQKTSIHGTSSEKTDNIIVDHKTVRI